MKRTFAITSVCLVVLLLGATFAVQAGTVSAQSGVLHLASHAMSSARHAVSAMFQETGHVQANHLTSSAHMVSARSNACSVTLKDHRVLVTGGAAGEGVLSSAEILSTNARFSSVPPMREARSEHGCALLPDGRVLVAGGRTNSGGDTNSSEIFDPETNSWAAGPQMMWARAGATFSILKDGRVLIAGGESSGNPTNTLEIYDPSTASFVAVRGQLSAPRTQHAAALLRDGRVLIAGGTDGAQSLATAEIFDPATGEITLAANMNIARAGLTATSMLNGQVLILGGSDGKNESATAEAFSARTGRFTVVPNAMSTARRDHVAIRIPDNNSILIAGGTSAGDSVSSTELYIPWRHAFVPMAAMDVTRAHALGIAGRSGNVMIAGGVNHHDTTGTTDSLTSPTIKTDKSDYPPGTPVIFTGANWTPGATVIITMTESDNPAQDTPNPITVTVAADGTIYNNGSFAPDINDLNVTFYVTATEYDAHNTADGLTAQMTFTDGGTPVNATGPFDWSSSSGCGQSSVTATVGTTFCAKATGLGNAGATFCWYSQLANTSVATSLSAQSGTYSGSLTPGGSSSSSNPAPGYGGTWEMDAASGQGGTCSAPVGNYTASTCSAAGSGCLVFTVGYSAPTITSVSPNSGNQGQSVTVTITGTNFAQGTTVGVSGTGVSAGTVTFVDSTKMTVTITIASNASTGSRTITVTNPSGGGSATVTFTVNSPADNTAISAVSGSAQYGSTTGTASATLTDTATSTPVSGATISFTVNGNTYTATTNTSGVATATNVDVTGLNAGSYSTGVSASFTAATIGGTSYNASGPATGALNVSKANQGTVTVTGPSSITYGGTGTATSSGGNGGGAVTFDVGTSTGCSVSGATVSVSNASGTCNLTATKAGDNNYNISSASASFQVTLVKASQAITGITVPNTAQTYNTTFTASATGGASGNPVTVTASGGCSGSGNAPATITMTSGTTACSLAFDQAQSTNYDAAPQQTASVTAQKATATVSFNSASMEPTYTGSSLTPTATTTPSGLTVNITGAPQTSAGSYPVTATISDNNYQGSASGTFVVDKAAATVSFSNMEQTYSGSGLSPTVTTSPANLSVSLTGAPQTSAGSYPVSVSVTDSNYTGSASGTFTIDKANATISVTGYSVTYDGNAHTATGTATGVGGAPIAGLSRAVRANSAVVSNSLSGLDLSGTTHTTAGSYTDTWTFTDTTGNYNSTSGQVSDSIAKADQSIVVGTLPSSQTYNTTFTASATGGNSGNPVTVTASGGCSGSGNAPATITMTSGTTACSLAFDQAGNTNYNAATQKTASVTAQKASATVNFNSASMEQTYTGSSLTPTATTTPTGLTVNITGAPQTSAGSYPVTATISDNNYQGSASGTFVIDKASQAALSVTGPSSVTYGQSGTATSSGGSSSGAVTFDATGSTGCSLSGATVTVTSVSGSCSLTATKAGDNNYLPVSTTQSLTVKLYKAPITVTAANQSMTFGAAVPTLTAGITGSGATIAAADGITASATTSATSSTDVGGYTITPSLNEPNSKLSNYSVTPQAGTLTISAYPDSATATVTSPATYEGHVTMTGQLAVPSLANGAIAATSAAFAICGANGAAPCQVMATGVSVSSTGFATATASLVETVAGALDPTKAHTLVVQFGGGSPSGTGADFSIPPASASLTINPVQATPVYGSFYTGASVFWTPTQTSNTATMFLSATLQDSSCTSLPSPSYGTCGDISKAKVSFGIRNGDGSVTPIAGATNLPVGYVDQTNHAVGSAATSLQYTLQSNAASAQLDIAVTVSGYYAGNNPKWDYVVTVARPVPGGSLLFAGTNVCNAGPGSNVDSQQDLPCSTTNGTYSYPEAGVLVGDATTLSAIQGNVTWNKSQTNPQGQILAVVVSPYNAQGVKDGISHTYQIKSNAISTFVVKNTWAQFTGKASIVDVATNTAVDGGALINITVCNGGTACPTNSAKNNSTTFTAGRDGAISLQVNNSKTGGAWFVIGWNGANSVPQNSVTGSITVNP